MSLPLFSWVAAVTVDWVPAGVDPSSSRGSEITSVEAIRLVEERLEARQSVLAAARFAARDIIMVSSFVFGWNYCFFRERLQFRR
jgi:hypothetical protein